MAANRRKGDRPERGERGAGSKGAKRLGEVPPTCERDGEHEHEHEYEPERVCGHSYSCYC